MKKQPGVFLSCEGPDGAGKTTNIPFLKACLEAKGFEVLTTREPGGTRFGDELRQILLNTYMCPMSEMLLFAASRAQHIEEVIKPALAQGKVVITDRFSDSTAAYQGYGRGHLVEVRKLELLVHEHFYPNHTLFFNIPFDVCLERLRQRTDKQDRLDQEGVDFKHRVWEGYQLQYKANPYRMVGIDANQSPEGVQHQLGFWVDAFFTPKYQHLLNPIIGQMQALDAPVADFVEKYESWMEQHGDKNG